MTPGTKGKGSIAHRWHVSDCPAGREPDRPGRGGDQKQKQASIMHLQLACKASCVHRPDGAGNTQLLCTTLQAWHDNVVERAAEAVPGASGSVQRAARPQQAAEGEAAPSPTAGPNTAALNTRGCVDASKILFNCSYIFSTPLTQRCAWICAWRRCSAPCSGQSRRPCTPGQREQRAA